MELDFSVSPRRVDCTPLFVRYFLSMDVTIVAKNGKNEGMRIPIKGEKFLIGAAQGCHMRTGTEGMHPKHCLMVNREAYAAVRNLSGDPEALQINGKPVEKDAKLRNGVELTIGPLVFDVEISVRVGGDKKAKIKNVSEVATRTVEKADDNLDIMSLLDAATAAPKKWAPDDYKKESKGEELKKGGTGMLSKKKKKKGEVEDDSSSRTAAHDLLEELLN